MVSSWSCLSRPGFDRGPQQPGELPAALLPGFDGLAGGGVGPGQVEEGSLPALEGAGDGRLAAPDPGVGGLGALGQVERGRDQKVPDRGKLGQVVERLGLGGGGQEDLGQIVSDVRGLNEQGPSFRVLSFGPKQMSQVAQAEGQIGMALGIPLLGIQRLVHLQRPLEVLPRLPVVALA